MNVTVIQGPSVEPVSLEEAKLFIRLDSDYENKLIEHLIATSRQLVENYTKRALITQTRRLLASNRDIKGNCITLPGSPFQEMAAHPKIILESKEIELTNYSIDKSGIEARFILESGFIDGQQLQIDYRCGYGDGANDVPQAFKHSMLSVISFLYDKRGEKIDLTSSFIDGLIDSYRVFRLA